MNSPSANRPALAALVPPKGVIVVATIDEPAHAGPLAELLAEARVGSLEITMRTPQAVAAIREAVKRQALPVGAGTVADAAAAAAAAEAGAAFVVSPDFNSGLADHCLRRAIPYLPGAITPTEVATARGAGFAEVKLYPIEQFGGPDLIDSLAAVFPDMAFVPTGGIDAAKAPGYLAHPSVLAVAGSWIAPRSLLAAGDWAEIERRAGAAQRHQE